MPDEKVYVKQLTAILDEMRDTKLVMRIPEHYAEAALVILEQMATDRRGENTSRESRSYHAASEAPKDWRDEPATDGQLKYMIDLGLKPHESMTKGEADKLIKDAQARP